jgi:hypothetical protein
MVEEIPRSEATADRVGTAMTHARQFQEEY